MYKTSASLFRVGATIFKNPKFFYCKIPLSKDLTYCLWERPGHWCSEEQLEKIVNDLREVASQTTEGKEAPHYGVLIGELEDLKRRVISIVYNKDNEPVAFSAQIYLDLQLGLNNLSVIHLGLAYVSPHFRGQNLTNIIYALPNLVLLFKSGFRCQWVSNVSQVPAAIGLVQNFYSDVYPSTNQMTQSYDHFIIGKKIMKNYKDDFGVGDDCHYLEKEQIITNAYTGGSDNLKKEFKEAAPYRKDESVNEMCEHKLNYERGDDFLQIGTLDIWLITRFIKDKAISSDYGHLVFDLFVFMFMAIFLPIIRWLIPKHDLEKGNSIE